MDSDKYKALQSAIEADDLMAISDLLAQGVKPSPHDFVQALRQRSTAVLQLFLMNGHNINERVRDD